MAVAQASGIILAGGSSHRMGIDKASLSVRGETLLARTVRIMSEVSDDILVIGRARGDDDLGARYFADDLPDAGPLGGLLTGLRRARYPYALAVACDMPFLDAAVPRLLLKVAKGYDAAVPRLHGRAQPTLAIYSRSSVDAIERQIARRDLTLRSLLATLRVRWIEEEEIGPADPGSRSFRNVNTPHDWLEAQLEANER